MHRLIWNFALFVRLFWFCSSQGHSHSLSRDQIFLDIFAGDDLLDHQFLSKEEIAARGYDSEHVKQAAIFPKDGVFPPYLDQALDDIVTDNGGNVLDHMQLKEAANGGEDIQVSKIVWENTKNGEISMTSINSLYLSLGPSMKCRIIL